ncbi:aminoacyl-tRNA hydrolase [Marinicauda salina]|uniref:Aminoacyl-tRNA hydrolase n=1 Tax=Marinicauda salina TaxID=2135793 RepID=A0A2U2BTK5_9PROT|nr:alternative ribosome rescue aminoacyl-tRNA hydrolase ArfB [Marinicauda salina]PWE17332.1 aminoacyl-tRNA hydrolase [Marinicauda salina]
MRITEHMVIDEALIEERYTRSPGPGGQHVNKAETAVQLRFDVDGSDLSDDVKKRLADLAGSRMTHDGVLIVKAHGERSRERNREAARERLTALIRKALKKPKPRRRTRPSAASVRRQKAAKERRSRVKSLRSKPKPEE